MEIILNKKYNSIDLLQTGYNFIKKSLYNEELLNKIIKLIEEELKNEGINETLEEFLRSEEK